MSKKQASYYDGGMRFMRDGIPCKARLGLPI